MKRLTMLMLVVLTMVMCSAAMAEDLTDRWGGLFAACSTANKQLVFTANTPGGVGALMTPDTALFVKKLLTAEESRG